MSQDAIPLFPAAPPSLGAGFTGRDLWRQWFKYGGSIVGATLTVAALTVYAALMQPVSYVYTAKVWVKTDQQGSPSFLSGVAAYREGQAPDPVNRKIETEMQLLMSRPNLEAVVRKLGIRPGHFVGSPLSYVLGAVAKKDTSPQKQFNDTVDAFAKAIKVEPARSKTADTASNMLEIKLESTDAQLAEQALNALVAQYQQYGAAQTRQQGQAAYTLIGEKMRLAQVDLDALDARLLQLTIAQGRQGDVDAPVASAANSPTIQSEGGLRLDTMLGSSRAGGTSAVGMIKSQTVTLQSRVEELRQLYTDDAEVVRNAQRQLAQAERRLGNSVKAGATLEAQLRQLERARALAQDRYTELRRKLDQIELYLSSALDEVATRVVTEQAQAPDKPESKKKTLLMVLGPLAGLALGLLLASLRGYFDHRLQSAQDVARYLGLETLGILPETNKAKP